ncbi:uncharacterized protein LOC119639571 [Glossina fuscipes]|uniref:Uncharacterized protein LOC119639571 n=2 Tax=Nemorhina TaxID=44051 RepID=A0A9C5Z2X1_9MUSC|nr:uncharacterized protein LOC119639571 [Glossina fuscipes]KAI9579605.1 hypothetical protein GQX74_000393 [Glossina fuscipes]
MSLNLQIEKLRGLDNYKPWSMTVRAYLESEDLWTVVEHGPDSSEQSLIKDRRAKFIILCLIEQKLCQCMVSIRSARDLWSYLKQQHSMR